MTSLIKKALASMESMEVNVQVTSPDTEAKPQTLDNEVVENNTKQEDKLTIALDGPLSNVYFKALNIAYAKVDTVTGTPTAESEQMTQYRVAAEEKKKEDTELNNDAVDINASGTSISVPIDSEVIPVIKELSEAGFTPDFVFVDNTMHPTDDSPVGASTSYSTVIMGGIKQLSVENIEGYSIVLRLKK